MTGNILILAGSVFCLVGCIGLVRLSGIEARVRAVVKSMSAGICLILLGVFASQGFTDMGVRALLCAVFIWVGLPAAVYAVVRGLYKSE